MRIEYDAWRRCWVAEQVTPATRTSPETAVEVARGSTLAEVRAAL